MLRTSILYRVLICTVLLQNECSSNRQSTTPTFAQLPFIEKSAMHMHRLIPPVINMVAFPISLPSINATAFVRHVGVNLALFFTAKKYAHRPKLAWGLQAITGASILWNYAIPLNNCVSSELRDIYSSNLKERLDTTPPFSQKTFDTYAQSLRIFLPIRYKNSSFRPDSYRELQGYLRAGHVLAVSDADIMATLLPANLTNTLQLYYDDYINTVEAITRFTQYTPAVKTSLYSKLEEHARNYLQRNLHIPLEEPIDGYVLRTLYCDKLIQLLKMVHNWGSENIQTDTMTGVQSLLEMRGEVYCDGTIFHPFHTDQEIQNETALKQRLLPLLPFLSQRTLLQKLHKTKIITQLWGSSMLLLGEIVPQLTADTAGTITSILHDDPWYKNRYFHRIIQHSDAIPDEYRETITGLRSVTSWTKHKQHNPGQKLRDIRRAYEADLAEFTSLKQYTKNPDVIRLLDQYIQQCLDIPKAIYNKVSEIGLHFIKTDFRQT